VRAFGQVVQVHGIPLFYNDDGGLKIDDGRNQSREVPSSILHLQSSLPQTGM
jgi:hypothetical protein